MKRKPPNRVKSVEKSDTKQKSKEHGGWEKEEKTNKPAKNWKEKVGKRKSVSDWRKEDQLLLGNHDRADK